MNNASNKTDSGSHPKGAWLSRGGVINVVLFMTTALVFYVCYLLAYPFLPAIIWALTLAVVVYPIHDRLVRRFKHPNISSGVAVAIVALLIVGPGIFVGQTIVNETSTGVESLRKQTESEQWRTTIEKHPQLARAFDRVQPYLDIRGIAENVANALAKALSALVGGSIWILAQLFITLFTLFYLLRDRRAILKAVASLMPLSQPETDSLFSRVADTINATIYGIFAVALVQGTLGGLMFWWLGLPGPVLWGIVMALLALIPVLGAPVVWVPAALILALTGSWGKAIILTAWGLIVIGIIDNLLYPILVGDKLRMHTLLVFFSVVGGLILLGSSGLILGPAAVAVLHALMDVWRRRTSDTESRNT